jgi:hypothetical protein
MYDRVLPLISPCITVLSAYQRTVRLAALPLARDILIVRCRWNFRVLHLVGYIPNRYSKINEAFVYHSTMKTT